VRFVLASQSPARLRTLRDAGVAPEVIVSDVDEEAIVRDIVASSGAHPNTADTATLLAAAKAAAVANSLDGQALVLGCDSLLELNGESFGKPGSEEDAALRWQDLSGAVGTLWTGHCLYHRPSSEAIMRTVPTTVHFAHLDADEIDAYCATGEPARVAGGFTIDGLGGWFVERIEGDHHNVVGLSLPTLREMLTELGYTLEDIGYPGG